ncbi:Crp/Fnr family transcriptional regulator [Lederbergia panacisoli]|uniref:Crp/Fnr family transcriptional regulator n=1 Tax=Lederbergia panacisoli TaxID=1255251 RepID=UPI00214AEA5D|nr:Crp/Fnr family transcriptional regulator [Lederbergia panacisoli]MCR2821565.1 Crp/Fnr family transcriptional regulator [Lederbergia panacisoli]
MRECGHLNPNANDMQQLCISLVPIFNHLKPGEMKEIVKTTRHVTYERNQEIYGPEDHSDHLYIVHRGRVKIYRLSEAGKEQLLRILEPGDFMGELALFSASTFDHYAVTMEKTELCIMRRSELQTFLMKYPAISLKVLEEFSRRLERTEIQVSNLTSEDTEKRIAMYLLELLDQSDKQTITLPISKKDIASYLGTTPETVSRKLAEFQQRGWLEQIAPKKIRILDKQALIGL